MAGRQRGKGEGSIYFEAPRVLTQPGAHHVVALVDHTGTVTDTYTYDPYGVPAATSGSTPNPFTYANGQTDINGLIKFGIRYYQPELGTRTQRDRLPGATRGGAGCSAVKKPTLSQ